MLGHVLNTVGWKIRPPSGCITNNSISPTRVLYLCPLKIMAEVKRTDILVRVYLKKCSGTVGDVEVKDLCIQGLQNNDRGHPSTVITVIYFKE